MSDDIKSMIKSRRDERYYGSAFEKRDPRMDAAAGAAASARAKGKVANEGVMPYDEYTTASENAYDTGRQANHDNREYPGAEGRLKANRRDPDHDEYVGGNPMTSRNVGIPKKQRGLDSISGGAQDYAEHLDRRARTDYSELTYSDFQALRDIGYSEDDIRKFEEMFDIMDNARYDAVDNAEANARRIRNMRQGREPEE